MARPFTEIQYRILHKAFPRVFAGPAGAAPQGGATLRALLGGDLPARIAGKTVVDFGCGEGGDAITLARSGARRVIGIDIREDVLGVARERARSAGVESVCSFGRFAGELADIVVSIDAFEHVADPAAVLSIMHKLLKPGGELLISFGPTWYHPLGGHLFSVFPWAHLLFSETALIRWRADFRNDGATRFEEVAGGLNRMTIRRFESIVRRSAFNLAALEAVPIHRLRFLHNRWTRECTTAAVRCRLVRPK